MKWRLRLLVVVGLLAGCGAAVYLTRSGPPVSLSTMMELWGDVLRDVDYAGMRLTRVSDADENRLGQDLFNQVAAWLPQDVARQPYVEEVGRTVAAGARRQGIRYEFHTVVSGTPNAFALPGGHVLVTSAMLDFLENEAELAAVLGHEVAHIDLRHAIERYQLALRAKKLHVAPVGEAAQLLRWLVAMEYSKYQELDADAEGIRLTIAAGYAPDAALALFQRFAQRYPAAPGAKAKTPVSEAARVLLEAPSAYFRTHPMFEERVGRAAERNAGNREYLKGRTFYRGTQNYRRLTPRSRQEFAGETVQRSR